MRDAFAVDIVTISTTLRARGRSAVLTKKNYAEFFSNFLVRKHLVKGNSLNTGRSPVGGVVRYLVTVPKCCSEGQDKSDSFGAGSTLYSTGGACITNHDNSLKK